MTDKEIIKALGICSNSHIGCDTDCPYKKGAYACRFEMPKDALALINRQQAEIEDLKIALISKVVIDDYATEYDNKIKAEAVKEFVERLKKEARSHYFDNCYYVIPIDAVDNLVEEMVKE